MSDSFKGQEVKLFLLKEGKVIQEMEGQYDSYGRVFTEGNESSVEWEMEWSKVCDLILDQDDSNGVAVIHSKCWTGNTPTTASEDDPNQGWGST